MYYTGSDNGDGGGKKNIKLRVKYNAFIYG